MEAFLQFAGMAGFPTSFVGVMLFLYFTVRKQEAVVRTEQLETIERQRTELIEHRSRAEAMEEVEAELRRRMSEQDSEYRKLLMERELENHKLKIELLHLGWQQEEETHGTE